MSEMISPEYRAQAAQLHRSSPRWGDGGGRWKDAVLALRAQYKAETVLDYGCGKGTLAASLPFQIGEYDPAIPGKDVPPEPADLVVCTDVLEHVEPDKLNAVLADLQRLTLIVGYFVINTAQAQHLLPGGRNAHLIQEGRTWWTERLSRYFAILQATERRPKLHYVVGPLR